MRIEDFLAAVAAKQSEIAFTLVSKPILGPGVDQRYLLAVGQHSGLEMAKEIITSALEDKRQRETDL